MCENRKLSVIMPVFNAAAYVERAIQSVLNQTWKELELILINDASTDNSLELMRKWEKTDPRILVVDKENEGVSVARNTGIALAKGAYVTFVDADDYLEPDAYETVLAQLEQSQAQAALYAFYDETETGKRAVLLPWETGTVLGPDKIWGQLIPYMIKVFPEDGIADNVYGSVWRMVVKKDSIQKNQVSFDPALQIAEDFDFCIHLFSRLEEIVIVNRCFYHYVRWDNTAMAVYRKNQFMEGMENQHRLQRFLMQEGKYEALEQRYIGSYLDVCIGSLVNFVRPGAPALLQTRRELKSVMAQIASDSVYDKLDLVPLTRNQKLVLTLIQRKQVMAVLFLTKVRQVRKNRRKGMIENQKER